MLVTCLSAAASNLKQKCKRDIAMPPYDFVMMRISPICLQVC